LTPQPKLSKTKSKEYTAKKFDKHQPRASTIIDKDKLMSLNFHAIKNDTQIEKEGKFLLEQLSNIPKKSSVSKTEKKPRR